MHIKRYNEINLVPLIDVLLVLLVVVLLTSSFVVHQVLKVDLPNATQGEAVADHKPIVVLVLDAQGKLYWHDEATDLAEVSSRLSALPIDSHVDIRVDAACGFAAVVSVVDLLKSMKMTRFALHTQQPK
jgi:biopolymer transport protein ExbD